VFKVQANMDPAHRDRIAFMRLCSGKFERGMKLTPSGSGKPIAVHSPDPVLRAGPRTGRGSLSGRYHRHPQPRHAARRRHADRARRSASPACRISRPNPAPRRAEVDPTKTKQLRKALDDMAEEGVIQVFYPEIGSNWMVGVVGQLQLEVLLSRLEAEYKVAAKLEQSPWDAARWISGDEATLKAFVSISQSQLARDRDGAMVFMAKSAWEMGYIQERNPEIRFSATKERRLTLSSSESWSPCDASEHAAL
jgi:peptide chain release factor 3